MRHSAMTIHCLKISYVQRADQGRLYRISQANAIIFYIHMHMQHITHLRFNRSANPFLSLPCRAVLPSP